MAHAGHHKFPQSVAVFVLILLGAGKRTCTSARQHSDYGQLLQKASHAARADERFAGFLLLFAP